MDPLARWLPYYICGGLLLTGMVLGNPVDQRDPDPDTTIDDVPDLFEGDMAGIRVDELAQFSERNGVLAQLRWPDNRIPFVISTSFSGAQLEIIVAALNEISARAVALRFVPRSGTNGRYVSIQKGGAGTGCYSNVGRLFGNGPQYINLEVPSGYSSRNCVTRGVILHELLHTAGFHHEQSKTDRDQYVSINWSNIAPEHLVNFMPYGGTSTSFGEPYDFGSIMHYGKFDFAKTSNVWTIQPKNPWHLLLIGQRNGLSSADLRKLNAMYPPKRK